MKTKYFALLLVIPVAIFAADRLTASNSIEGGGKEKKTTETKSPTPTQEATQAEPAVDEPTQTPDEATQATAATETKASKTNISSAHKKQILTDEEALSSQYYDQMSNDQFQWLDDEVLGEAEVAWLEKNVSDVLDELNPLKMNLARSFSRCPSGYFITLIKDKEMITKTGWLIGQDGCSDVPMGRFRYNRSNAIVEVFVGTSDEVLSLQDFCRTYAAAKS